MCLDLGIVPDSCDSFGSDFLASPSQTMFFFLNLLKGKSFNAAVRSHSPPPTVPSVDCCPVGRPMLAYRNASFHLKTHPPLDAVCRLFHPLKSTEKR